MPALGTRQCGQEEHEKHRCLTIESLFSLTLNPLFVLRHHSCTLIHWVLQKHSGLMEFFFLSTLFLHLKQSPWYPHVAQTQELHPNCLLMSNWWLMDLPSVGAYLEQSLLGTGLWMLLVEISTLLWKQLADRQTPWGVVSCLQAHWLWKEFRSQSWGLWVRELLINPPEPHSSTASGLHTEQWCGPSCHPLRGPVGQADKMHHVHVPVSQLYPPWE
jgi:hypothetical protein